MNQHQQVGYSIEFHPALTYLFECANKSGVAANDISLSSLLDDVALPISSSVAPLEYNRKEDHDAHPIKKPEDVNGILSYYLSNGQFRNAMLFVIGINFGLRVSDLRVIRYKDIIDSNMKFRNELIIDEQKTNNRRRIYINSAVKQMVALYLRQSSLQGQPKSLDDYLFVAENSNNKKFEMIEYVVDGELRVKKVQSPMSASAIDPILKNTAKKLNIIGRYSTHAYRKTFAYHILMQVPSGEINNKPNERQLEFLQKVFGHSNSATTLHYAGFTEEEIQRAYLDLNLGLNVLKNYKYKEN